jgi:HAUS augmin-like complex subunit 1
MNNHPTLSPPTHTSLEYSLFSPSKAAEQQRLAKDWTYIHNFLAEKYPFPQKVPKFEENEETLKCLLALAAWNEKGDEGWSGLCGVEREVVREMEEGEVSFVCVLFGGFGSGWWWKMRFW